MITIVLVFVVLFWAVKKNRRMDYISKRVLLFYVLLWGVVLSLAPLGLFNLYPPHTFSLVLLVLHVVMFVVGMGWSKKSILVGNNDFSVRETTTMFERITTSPIFTVLLIISTIVSVAFFMTMRSAFDMTENLGDVREDFYSGTLYGNGFGFLNNFILLPMETICLPIMGYKLFQRRDWRFFLMAVFLFAHASLSGGRFGYLRIMAAIFFMGFCIMNEKHTIFKRVRLMIVLAVLFFLLVGVITSLRSGEKGLSSDTTIEALYKYSVAPVSAFDYSINNHFVYIEKTGGYKYGGITGASAINLLYSVLSKVGIEIHQPIEDIAQIKQNNLIPVGEESPTWNALYTSVFCYYQDGGIIGVVIIPLLLGFIMRWLIGRLCALRTWAMMVIVCFFFHTMFRSICDFNFVTGPSLLMIIVLFFLGTIRPQGKNFVNTVDYNS